MITWFERCKQRCAFGCVAGVIEGDPFGVTTTGRLGRAVVHRAVVSMSTAPTHGFGRDRRRADVALAIARRIIDARKASVSVTSSAMCWVGWLLGVRVRVFVVDHQSNRVWDYVSNGIEGLDTPLGGTGCVDD